MREARQELTAAHLKLGEAVRSFTQEQSRLEKELGRRYSIVRVIDQASKPNVGLTNGVEHEVSVELSRQIGLAHDLHRPFIPFWALSNRAMNTGTGSQGGNLVGLDTSHTAPALFAASTLLRLGAQVVPVGPTDLAYPRIATNGTAAWLAEQGTASPTEPTFGAISVAMKTLVAPATITRQLLLQAAAPQFIGAHLLGIAGAEMDRAMIGGTGTSQFGGIINTAGIGTLVTGTGFTHANAQGLLRVASAANVPDENIRFLSTPTIRETLSQRATGTGNEARYIWQENNIADKPAHVSTNCLSGALVCGDFSTVHLLLWAGGMRIEINPYTAGFLSDIIAMKASLYADCVVTQPQSFAIGTGVT